MGLKSNVSIWKGDYMSGSVVSGVSQAANTDIVHYIRRCKEESDQEYNIEESLQICNNGPMRDVLVSSSRVNSGLKAPVFFRNRPALS